MVIRSLGWFLMVIVALDKELELRGKKREARYLGWKVLVN